MNIGFLVPGFSKCGTSSLCALLDQHPEIFIPKIKEPGYYAQHYKRGRQYYDNFFADPGEAWLLGEGSTPYSSSKFAEISCERIVAEHPNIRLIFIARDPVKRLESSFRELHTNGHKYGVYADYEIGKTLVNCPYMLLDSQYWKLINHYRKCVPDEQILVLFLEEFHRDPDRELRRCFEFLGVDPNVHVEDAGRRYNTADLKRYDTHLMRRLRAVGWFERRWRNLSREDDRRWGTLLRLRKRFVNPIKWDPAATALVQETLTEDARQFLKFYGRPDDTWKWGKHALGAKDVAA